MNDSDSSHHSSSSSSSSLNLLSTPLLPDSTPFDDDGGRELPSVHSWKRERGLNLLPNHSFKRSRKKLGLQFYCECVNDSGAKFRPILLTAWTEGSSLY